MHYYQFNIGDYASHTAHLDPIEDIAYRRMLDWCYTHETSLPEDVESIARLIRMREYVHEIRDVLNEFFERSEDGWFSSRVQREIDHYKAKIEQASKAGKASAERRLNGRSTGVQPTNNQEPITKNHKPRTKNQSKEATIVATYLEGLDIESWERWLSYRREIGKALKPASIEAAQESMIKFGKDQAAVVEQSIANGYQGLFALKETKSQERMSKQQALEARNDEVARQWLASKRNRT